MSVAVDYADLVAIALFIYGLHELNSPATARRGNRLAMAGMAIALVGIIIQTGGAGWPSVAVGIAIGGLVGVYAAIKVRMTAMPQMVALYNGAGGGAAALISTVKYFTGGSGCKLGRDRCRVARALRNHRCDQLRRFDYRVS